MNAFPILCKVYLLYLNYEMEQKIKHWFLHQVPPIDKNITYITIEASIKKIQVQSLKYQNNHISNIVNYLKFVKNES